MTASDVLLLVFILVALGIGTKIMFWYVGSYLGL